MYCLLFAKISVSLSESFCWSNQTLDVNLRQLLDQKVIYCMFLYVVMFPNILKKEIKELKFASLLLFLGVVSLLLTFLGKTIYAAYYGKDPAVVPLKPYENGNPIDAISILLTSYGFLLNFYPIYSSLDKRTNSNGIKATGSALIFCFIVYISFSFLGIASYGESINPNIFDNIKTENTGSSYFIRILFLGIFLCNLPFVFLPGKEALLIIIDEYRNRSMSKMMEKRIDLI